MDQRERINDAQEALLAALDGRQAKTWTALPGIIQSFNSDALTCVVQPAIKAQVNAPDGTKQWVALPLLVDVPVTFPRGGGCTLTFPVAKDDECLVVFSSRCIDAWWALGDVQIQSELRMHDLSDGFAIPGPFSQKTKISGWSTDSVQLRSNDGQAYVGLNPSTHEIDVVTTGNISVNAGGNLTATASGSASLTAPTITLNGNTTINGTLGVTGQISAGGDVVSSGGTYSMKNHYHVVSGIQTGAGTVNTNTATG